MAEPAGTSQGKSKAGTQPCPFQLHQSLHTPTLLSTQCEPGPSISQPAETILLLLTRQDPILGLPAFPEAHFTITQHDNLESAMAPDGNSHLK